MEFDKSKVFTSFNCDEVKIGSKGYVADSKETLIHIVQTENKHYFVKMIGHNESNGNYPFIADKNICAYSYFYLVEEPKEPTKRPCTREELVEMLKKQRLPMLLDKHNNVIYNFIHMDINVVNCISYIGDTLISYTYDELCEEYTLLDGTELWVEE